MKPMKAYKRFGCQACGVELDFKPFVVEGATACSIECVDSIKVWQEHSIKINEKIAELERMQEKGFDGVIREAFIAGFLMRTKTKKVK